MATRPSGTVTFLFTDIEGSTRLWEERPDDMRAALAEHDALVRAAIDAHSGYVFSTGGDGFAAAFSRAADAVGAAVEAQAALADHSLIRVRMGIHTGEVHERDGDYFGPAVNRSARIMAVAHGGQIVLSRATEGVLAATTDLVDLGEHRLRDLASVEHLFQVGIGTFPPLRTVDAFPSNLPRQQTSFVGREAELTELAQLVGACRLVTLTGLGGLGKTRLALQVAGAMLPRYADGAWFVSFAALGEPSLVGVTTASTLGVPQRSGESVVESLAAWAERKSALVVLDNCEHLIEAAAEVAAALTRSAPGVTVLATSRESLGVAGEQVWPVVALPLPPIMDATEPVVQLFLERARAVRPTFRLDDTNLGAVAEICRRLDGIPLAVELAAARVQGMAPNEIAKRLDQRFRLLAGTSRGTPERNRTLEAAMRWSYELLSADEQLLFRRLGVFFGSFGLDAAEAVVADHDLDAWSVLQHLLVLVNKSLVLAEDTRSDVRYRLLAPAQQFAVQLLEEHDEVESMRRRHLAHYRTFVDSLAGDLWGPGDLEARDHLLQENDNVTGALRESADLDDPVQFERFVASLYPLFQYNLILGEPWYREVIAAPVHDQQLRVLTLGGASYVYMQNEHPAYALELAEQAIELAEMTGIGAALARSSAACCCFMLGRHDDAYRHARGCIDDAPREADLWLRSHALTCVAAIIGTGDLDLPGRQAAAEALAIAEQLGNFFLRTHANGALGYCLLSDDPARAAALLEQNYADMERTGISTSQASSGQYLGILASRRGDVAESARWFALGLRATVDVAPTFITQIISSVVGCFRNTHPDEATRLLGGLFALRSRLHRTGSTDEARAEVRWRSALSEQLGEAFEPLFDEGGAFESEELLNEALAFLEGVARANPEVGS